MKRLLRIALPLALSIILYLVWIVLTYKNYAITSDEFSSYISGQIWFEYFQNKQITYNLARYHPLVNEHYRFYPMILFMMIGSLKYELFHMLNMLACMPIIISAYFLAFKNNKKLYALLIPLLFIFLTPRVLGDIPNNPKDMPFAISYFVALTAIYFSSDLQKRWGNNLKIILLGILIGFTQSLRPLGFGLYIIYFIWNFSNGIKTKNNIAKLMAECLNIFLIGLLVTTATWPAIGANFVANFKKYLSLGIDFNLWEGSVLYFGKEYSANKLPWHYLPIWLGITLPLSHLIFFLLGIYTIVKKNATNIQIYLYFTIAINIILYFLLRPSLYNAIRHYDFLVILISLAAGLSFINIVINLNKKYFISILAGTILYALVTLINIAKLHPYQNLYFNEIIGGVRGAQNSFDLDYWDTTYKEAADYLFQNTESTRIITVFSCGARTALDYYLGERIEQKKNASEAEYVICDPAGFSKLKDDHIILHTIEKDKAPIIVIGRR